MIESGEKSGATLAPFVVAGLAFSLFPIVYLHVVSIGEISPIRDTISDYVFVDGGSWLLPMTSLTLAAASAVLGTALKGTGQKAAWLIGLWSAGLTVSTIFPTDPIGHPTSLSGLVHRYAGAVMFVALPLAGFLISRRYAEFVTLRRLAIASGVTSMLFLLSHVGGMGARGLAERILFLVLYGLLFALATQLRRTT